jgi:hypothetical protein
MFPKPAKVKGIAYASPKTKSNSTLTEPILFVLPLALLKLDYIPLTIASLMLNCLYFNYFNSKEKKLYTRFNDKFEENFEGKQYLDLTKTNLDHRPYLFKTLTFNTTDQDHYS